MNHDLSILIDLLKDPRMLESKVIPWAAPIPCFGDISKSKIATVGLNPSNREYVNIQGLELEGADRRFHTLSSLGISEWSNLENKHLEMIYSLCKEYFYRNPYDAWFKKLDFLISGTTFSYYFPSLEACHLDLIPFATFCKWGELTSYQKEALLLLTRDTLGRLVRNSPIQVLILNGMTVVNLFEKTFQIHLTKSEVDGWRLPNKKGGVKGFSFTGLFDHIGGIALGRSITVLGYNHNIQSSFGVTSEVQSSIRNWITNKVNGLSI